MILEVGTKLVLNGKYPRVARILGNKNIYYSVPNLESKPSLLIEFDDGSMHDYWSEEDIKSLFYEFEYGMILYCGTGRSSFCTDWASGYYKTFKFDIAEWLGKTLVGSSQEDFQRTYKLKAFW